jgi:hypothetical protein
MNKANMSDKDRFLSGELAGIRLGGYGGTVHIELLDSSEVQIRTSWPKRAQRTVGLDSTAVRAVAMKVAEGILANARSSRAPSAPSPAKPARNGGPGVLTPRDIWLAYIRSRLGVLPPNVLNWGRGDLEKFYTSCTPRQRALIKKFDSINGILVAARALDRLGIVRLDCDMGSLEAGAIGEALMAGAMGGYSAHTMASYFGKFRTAVRFYKKKWHKKWGVREDPTQDVDRPSLVGIEPPEIGEEPAEGLIRQLLEDGDWRTAAALKVARASGRRISAIAGARQGMHLDAPPLTAMDFERETVTCALVTWRANAAKGGAYGRGDEVQVCPRELAVVHRWLARFHPNPNGPEHPLIWDRTDPTRAASYDFLSKSFSKAWRRAFDESKPKGLAWHAVIRTTVTTIADAEGLQAAAEHTGRDVETAGRLYKRRRRASQANTAAALDRLRSENGARP